MSVGVPNDGLLGYCCSSS